jgi:hypothetical protein
VRFFLGTHKVIWLARTTVPLFVSHRQARERVGGLTATCDWALDSGGYTELSTHGRWTIGVNEYVDAVARYADWGRLQWAAPQDWMTESWILELTGKSVREHQELTVGNFLTLAETGLPFIPVLQGQTVQDYLDHVEMYSSAGIDLSVYETVGVGSVCRRQGTREAEQIFTQMAELGISCHGFGVKIDGLRRYSQCLASADSMAWSVGARHAANKVRKAGNSWRCPYGAGHTSCSNCMPYALKWRDAIVGDESG